jgi:hypothetical protein
MQSLATSPVEDVVFTDFESGEGILVNLNTKQYFRLNETGALIWKGLERGRTAEEIASDLQHSYEVSGDHALQSVRKLLQTLQTNQLIKMN